MSRADEPKTPTRILLIEDSNTDALLIRSHLKKADAAFDLRREERLDTGLVHLDRGDMDVVLLDLNLPDSSGLDTFRSVHRQAMHLPIVILSGQEDVQLAVDAVSLGAQDYLTERGGQPQFSVPFDSLCDRTLSPPAGRTRTHRGGRNPTPPLSATSATGQRIRFVWAVRTGQSCRRRLLRLLSHGRRRIGRCGRRCLGSRHRSRFDYVGNTRHSADTGDDLQGGRRYSDARQSGAGRRPAQQCVRCPAVDLPGTCPADDSVTPVPGMPGVLLEENGQVRERICSPDPPLGIIEGRQFATVGEVQLHESETLLLYTDGIVEMFNRAR